MNQSIQDVSILLHKRTMVQYSIRVRTVKVAKLEVQCSTVVRSSFKRSENISNTVPSSYVNYLLRRQVFDILKASDLK